ncbi:MAG: glycosyltransferase [bacterium]|nr:glycosyltransferase [bacterium]
MKKTKVAKTLPLVSIIIPTRNSKRTIGITLKSIANQSYPNKEIVVVDQESTDGTLEIAKRYATKVLSSKGDAFYSAPPVSRNIGARVSKGKYFFHIDSDMELTPEVIKECVELLEKNLEILAVKIHEKDIGEGFWSRAKILERKCYIGYDAIEAARFMRRIIFFKLGSYDENLRSAEDWDMSKRIQKVGKIGEIQSFINHHIGRLSYFSQIKKKFNYGLTMERVLTKHGFNLKKEFSMVFRITYLTNIKLFLLDPIGTIGFLILRPSELLAYVAGMLWAKIK